MHPESWTAGVDLGGTKIEVAQVFANGTLGKRIRTPTHAERSPEQVINDLIVVIHQLQDQVGSSPVAIGIGMAGQIEAMTGTILFAPNLKWHQVPLTSIVHKKLEIPTFMLNDVRAATWGEWLHGAGRGCNDFVCVFFGTGIGSGVVSGGAMLNGSSNSFGEVGHMIVDYDGPPCTCGSQGCFEAIAGGWGIAAEARRALEKGTTLGQTLLAHTQGNVEKLSAKDVIECAKQGDSLAQALMKKAMQGMIAGCIGIANVLNPSRLIIGGGLGGAFPDLIAQVKEGIAKKALRSASKDLQVIPVELGNDAGVIGAAAFAQMHREVHR